MQDLVNVKLRCVIIVYCIWLNWLLTNIQQSVINRLYCMSFLLKFSDIVSQTFWNLKPLSMSHWHRHNYHLDISTFRYPDYYLLMSLFFLVRMYSWLEWSWLWNSCDRYGYTVQKISLTDFELSKTLLEDAFRSVATKWNNEVLGTVRTLAQGDDWNFFFKVKGMECPLFPPWFKLLKTLWCKLETVFLSIQLQATTQP